MQDQILFTTQTKTELIDEIVRKTIIGFHEAISTINTEDKTPEYYTGKQVEKILNISAKTRYEWGRKKILKPYKIGSRTRYKRNEVFNALRTLEAQDI